MSMKLKIKSFFGSNRQYVVVGASNNPSKFGFKILNWYVTHKLSVIPINPKEQEILQQPVVNNVVKVIQAVEQHQDISTYKTSTVDGLSISFLTPPKITSATLLEISTIPEYQNVVKGLWFQPGSYDQEVLDIAQQIGLFDKVIHEDECILVRGEEGMLSANL
ncbi:hypothetical protein JA1_002559 [Spathaspora sp. JA1]|nr:hypothetical protein JA1_002559 [Spathaspora sp. JA1]